MKRSWWIWVLGLVVVIASSAVERGAFAFDVPRPDGRVTDLAGVLSPADDAFLEARVAEYERASGHEIGVLVLRSLGGETVEDVAYRTFNDWGVGKRGADDGVLVVVATTERRTRIETGKGIGDRLTDVEAARILETRLAPRLREGRFREGLDATVLAIEAEVDGRAPAAAVAPRRRGAAKGEGLATIVVVTGAFGVFLVMLVVLVRGRRGRGLAQHDARAYGHHVAPDVHHAAIAASSFDAGSSASFGGGCSGGGGASGGY